MATANSLRRERRKRPSGTNPRIQEPKEIQVSEMNIGQKSKLAHQLVKNGEASDLKEAWAIIKNS